MLTPVAPGVFAHQSPLLRNNTVVVQGDDGVLLVDPGITAAEMRCLAADLRDLGMPVVAGFATHPDWDHALWHPAFGDAPRWGTAACAAFLRDLRAQRDWQQQFADALPPEIVTDVPIDPFGLIEALPADGGRFPWNGPEVRVVAHPGHAVGHAALVVEGSRVLIAGDMLSDVFVPMPDLEGADDALGDYLAGLDALASVTDHVDAFVPGHGSVGDAAQLRQRLALDRRYIETLRDGGVFDDPRIDKPESGWEWVGDLHAGQVESVARRGGAGDG